MCQVKKLYQRNKGLSSDGAIVMYLKSAMQLSEYGHQGFEALVLCVCARVGCVCVCACVHACVRACVRACMHACVRVCVCVWCVYVHVCITVLIMFGMCSLILSVYLVMCPEGIMQCSLKGVLKCFEPRLW